MASVIFDTARQRAMQGTLSWVADTYKVMLCKSYTPSAAHTKLSDGAIAGEDTDASYLANGTSGRVTLASKSATIASNRSEARANNVTYTALTGETTSFVVVYQDLGGADADNLLVCAIDIADVAETGLDLTIKWNGAATNGAVFKI